MIVLDCLGDICPLPVLKTQKALQNLKSGEIIKVITDHTAAHRNIYEHFGQSGLEIKDVEVIDGVWEIFITRV